MSYFSRHFITSSATNIAGNPCLSPTTVFAKNKLTIPLPLSFTVAGSFFHACLLLVLSRWKPSKDDSALFYVIAAAWGVCHAVWETLLFTLMSLTHKNHMLEVLTPIHGIQYLAMGVTFGAHGFLCEYAKIIVLAILLIVSVPPYASLEIRLEAQRKATQNSNAKSVLQIPTL